MASFVYNIAKKKFADGALNWGVDDGSIKVMLVTSAYSPNKDHIYVDDGVSAASARPGQCEVTGTGYAGGWAGSGRKAIDNAGATYTTQDDTNDLAKLDADDIVWSGINVGAVQAAVIYKSITSDAASYLIAYIDSGGFPVTTDGGNLTIAWAAGGVITLT
jgi:hypothetical protein